MPLIRKYLNLFSFLIFISFSIFLFLNFDINKETNNDEYINVYLNDNLNKLELGSSFKDLLLINNLDINEKYNISLEYILKDNEYLYINNNSNYDLLISINNASFDEFITLPGIGEKTANKIIEYRDKYGKFKHIEEIKKVSGIGDKKYEKIKELITI